MKRQHLGIVFLAFILAIVAPVDFGRHSRAGELAAPYGFENEIAGVQEIFSFEIPTEVETAVVVEVIDGDTVVLESGRQVRLIGINAPEIGQPHSAQATDLLAALTLRQEVLMSGDTTDTDQFERLLRYLFLDDKFINLEIVKSGLAVSYPFAPDLMYESLFLRAEALAHHKKLGIWKP